MARSRRRTAAALLSLMALSAAPFLASGGAGAAEATWTQSVTDPTSDQVTLGLVADVPQADITAADGAYRDGYIVLDMVTGAADDLHAASFVYWELYTSSTDVDNPDYRIFASPKDGEWTVLVNGNDFMGDDLCPTNTDRLAEYDADSAAYLVAFDASCIGDPTSFKFRAHRTLAGANSVDDVAPDAPAGPLFNHNSHGYWMVGRDGKVYAFGDAQNIGDPAGHIAAPVVDLEPTVDRFGYWVVDEKGGVYAYNAPALGNVDTSKLLAGEKVTSLSATSDGGGYWIFTSKGRVFTFGTATSFGDMAGTALNGEILDSIPTPSGEGYYMVGSDGGVFSFGDAKFAGSMGYNKLNPPVLSLVPDPDGTGYWLVASDGGIFAFNADFHGSMGNQHLNKPVTGMVPNGNGYLMVGEDGGIFNFSDQPFDGSLGANPPANAIVSVAAVA